ncbi:MAG: nucleotidyltransferase family protein [Holophagaceae bacterium]
MPPPSPDAPRPALDLLRACGAAGLGAAGSGAAGGGAAFSESVLRFRAAGGDWAELTALAARHGLLPLLTRALAAVPEEAPRQVFVDLWARQERLALRNQVLAGTLLEVLGRLDAAGLPALPFKGPVLADQLHGDVALREFVDLDILVPADRVREARALLEAAGFQPEFPLAPRAERAFLRSPAQYHLLVRDPARDVAVELHWRTDPDAPVEPAGDPAWWERLPRRPFLQGSVRALPPEDLLLVLAFHGSKHHWERLGWLVDLAHLLHRHSALDGAALARRAEALGASRRLALGLDLAVRLLGAPVPPALAAWAAARPGLRALAAPIEAALGLPHPPAPGPFRRLARDLRLFDSLPRKAAYATRTLFAPTLEEWTAWPLPPALGWLYPALRVGRLAGRRVGGGGRGRA